MQWCQATVIRYLQRARRISNYMVKEIADHFQRSPVTIGEAIMKVEDLLKRDKSFENAMKRMEENLLKGKKRKYRVSVALRLQTPPFIPPCMESFLGFSVINLTALVPKRFYMVALSY